MGAGLVLFFAAPAAPPVPRAEATDRAERDEEETNDADAEDSAASSLARRIDSLERRLSLITAAALQRGEGTPEDSAAPSAADVADPVFEAAVLDILDREQERKEEERTNRRVEVERARSTRMAEDLQSKLGLTADQKGKLATIVSAHFDALRALRESNEDNPPTTRREWRERTSQVNAQTEQKLAELLSPAQLSAYQELDGEDRITGGRGRGGNAEGRGQAQEGRNTNRTTAEPTRGR